MEVAKIVDLIEGNFRMWSHLSTNGELITLKLQNYPYIGLIWRTNRYAGNYIHIKFNLKVAKDVRCMKKDCGTKKAVKR